MSLAKLDSAAAAKLLEPLKYILLDIDGVIWSGSTVIEGVPETLRYLKEEKKKHVRFLTNNAAWSREEICEKFASRGMPFVQPNEIYNSGYAAALKLQQLLGKTDKTSGERKVHGNVFVIGEEGLHKELRHVLADGFITYGLELNRIEEENYYDIQTVSTAWESRVLPPPQQRLVLCQGDRCEMFMAGTPTGNNCISLSDLNCVAVVAGLDLHFNVQKLAYASLILQGKPKALWANGVTEEKASFIACNEDPQIPVGPLKLLLPGAGGMVQSLVTVSGIPPHAVCGKPNTDLSKILFEAEKVVNPSEECLMVGDRLSTDICFGNNSNCKTLFVLSGAEGLEDVTKASQENNTSFLPQNIADSLACFLPTR
ncbi:4-nitrophenyl phosphatase [Angomonas deanei]|uniref:Haloacid dehalogenase-like hydrolase/HAD-hyrolase-like, putative n=1 Tax=Angomonas deanei TaxID=59799 RepID=A0A7G2C1R0_9TRYP|nr:4-nitrophenyl phosphatase [Angomonas deanei]CAD2213556.1 Haloacid dehalogenase-like hydrolase/HAD-hyrolase-like, putative [Angomonas deanei]|eukprot:EPY33957.1 4-nitrophenyl phosphatase [Angomonas deanei]